MYGENRSKTWKLINEIAKRKRNSDRTIKCMTDKHGTKLEDPTKIANCLNEHFSSVGEKMASHFNDMDESARKNPLDYINENNRNSMYLAKTDTAEICRLILSLDVRKSCGYDQIRS